MMINFKDNKNKSPLNTRWAQMTKQEQIIERKKMEIQAKLESQKQAAALAARAKLSNPTSKDDKGNTNIFSNDGSFMSQFKSLLEKQKQEKEEKEELERQKIEEENKNNQREEQESDDDEYDYEDRRFDDRGSRENQRRWNDRGRNHSNSPMTPNEDRNMSNKNPNCIPPLMQIPIRPPDVQDSDPEQDDWSQGPNDSKDPDSKDHNKFMGCGPMPQGPLPPGMMGPGMMGPGPHNMGPGPMMGPGGPMPPFMGGPPNFPIPPNFMGPNGPGGPMPPHMMPGGPNGLPMPPFFPPFHNPGMLGPNGPPNGPPHGMGPNGPMNHMMRPNGPPNPMMGPNGPHNPMMGPNGPHNPLMPPNGPPNSLMGPNGPPNMPPSSGSTNSSIPPNNSTSNSGMGPNGPPNSMMGANGAPNALLGPNGPPMGPNGPPNSLLGPNGPPNSHMRPNGPPMMGGPPMGPNNSMMGPNGNMPFMGGRPPFGPNGPFGNPPFMNAPMPDMKHMDGPMPPLPPPPLNPVMKPNEMRDRPPMTSQVSTDSFPPAVSAAASEVATNGDHWEHVLKAIHSQDPNLWFLHNTGSNEYKKFRELVEKIKSERIPQVKDEDKYEPEFSLEDDDSNDAKPHFKEENSNSDYYNSSSNYPWSKRENASSQSDEEGDSKRERRKRKKKSRWGDEPPAADIKPPGLVAPLPPGAMPVPGTKLAKIDEEGLKLTNINRNNQALMQYAMTNYGTTNLNAEDWKKCEDNFKLNLLYQDMLKKRQEVERLAAAGKNKYEYDSDEDTSEGTWEHKLRAREMNATERWADELTKQAAGKHHIGDFLPPEELRKFMEKYSAAKNGKEPDLSDYKEFKLKEDNVGFKMLQKLGWNEGQGLGAEGSGIVDPINKANQPIANLGLGASTSDGVSPDDDEFEAYRKRMMLAYRFRPNPLNNPRRPYY